MAIQLARAIGMQGGIPQSNLPQIIKEGGDAIVGALKEERLAKEAKAKKEQDLKDAIAASIDYTGIDAHPVDNESYRNDWNKGLAYIAMQSKDPNVTSSQVAELRRNFKQEMEDKKKKYESDWKEIGEAAEAQGKTHETQYFKDYVNVGKEGTMVAKEKDDEGGLESNIEKKAVPALVQLPWEERKKIDLKQKFEELAVPILPNTIDVAKSIPSFGKDLEYKNYVTTTSTKKGGLDYSIDEDKIKKDAEFFANEVAERKLTPYSDKFMQYQNSLTKLVGKKVASELPEDQLEAGGDILKNEVKNVAYRAFYDDAMREAQAQTIKLREEREKGKGAGSAAAEDKKVKVAQITTQQPPALTRIGEKFAEKYEKKAKEAEDKAKRYERGGQVSAENINRMKSAAESLKESAKKAREQEFKVEDYYVFSSKPMTDDYSLSLTDEDNKTVKNFIPSYVFKKDGEYYIGGTVPKKDSQGKAISNEFEDTYVPYNEKNYRTLQQNRKGLTEELTKQGGYPTWTGKPAAKKQEDLRKKYNY